MSKRSEYIKTWRKKCKQKIIDGYGGKCMCCGYNTCNNALELHHVNPETKEVGFSKFMSHPQAFEKILLEVKKCVLVCSNCHKEIHAGVRKCPEKIPFIISDPSPIIKFDACPICGKQKLIIYKTCSRACAAKKARKINWDNIDLKQELMHSSKCKLADKLGITEAAIRKRIKKLGIIL